MSIDLKIGDIIGTRQVIDIVYEPLISRGGKIGRVYVTKCLRCGNIFKDSNVNRLRLAKCEKCKFAIEWNGQLFYNQTDMAKKLGVSKRSIAMWAKFHHNDFSEYTIEWSKSLTQGSMPKLKYSVGDIINNYEIIEITNDYRYPYNVKCLKCGKITKRRSDELSERKCRCEHKRKYNIGDIVNNRQLIKIEGSNCIWKCLDCGELVIGHISYPEYSACKCKQGVILAEKQITRETPSGLRTVNLPKNIHYRNPSKKWNAWGFCARVQARYNNIRKSFEYDSQDMDACLSALPALKMLARHYQKTGEHITYGNYIKMGSPELEI